MSKRENRVWRMGNGYWRQTDSEGLLKEVTLNGDLDGEGETQEDPGQRRQHCKGPGVDANVAWSRQREAGKAATKGKERGKAQVAREEGPYSKITQKYEHNQGEKQNM